MNRKSNVSETHQIFVVFNVNLLAFWITIEIIFFYFDAKNALIYIHMPVCPQTRTLGTPQ
jgi:hypothetical protein